MVDCQDGVQAKLSEWLDALASAQPTPGGGAVASISAAMGAGLIQMVCALSIGKRELEEHQDILKSTIVEAEQLRSSSLRIADEDTAAFKEVIAAYKLPRDTSEAKNIRRTAIEHALITAMQPPLKAAQVALQVIEVARRILDRSNPMLVSDVAVAAIVAKCALEASIINIEINLAQIKDPDLCDQINYMIDSFRIGAVEAGNLSEIVRERIKS